MHNLLIVEDDISQNKLLTDTIQHAYPQWSIISAADYPSAKDCIEKSLSTGSFFSLFLLDVQLTLEKNDRGGFCLAEEIRKHPIYFKTPILFLTAISDEGSFALSEFHCYNYITKPYSDKDILHQLEQMLITGYLENTLEITDTDRILHKLLISEILMVESKAHIMILHTFHGTIETREYSLKNILSLLSSDFLQCHKRMLVNKAHIHSYDKTSSYLLVGNLTVSVGRSYKKNMEYLVTQEGGESR